MDTARILLALKQGSRTLENVVRKSIAIANYSDLPDCLLIEFFCDSVNQPLQSELRYGGLGSSLAQFLDYALLTVGSSFTVGVAEEEHDIMGAVMGAVF
ncbi:Protein MGF 505-1R [Labeo rohita]|uniref:Protein MGF 505-1R n=1 Tax=Labeo rohita TaxID=84645 RepID=A0ABQ8MV58_LABRO|nr:Protein MGF 505-1R [Labeo rohita]